ncbi:hypothetical protein AAG570_006367 [Ranatra chinensis]|uniref:Serine/threonine-protein kinase ULK3 n=1 Tax=Ranatra chinensis TaxID=642074 RepID=A0ABD0YTT0_9HEMI
MSGPSFITKNRPSFLLDGYKIVGVIGSGSYSTVYKGIPQNGQEQFVAIKCVEKSKLSASGLENILTEIQMMKLMHHEFIVEMREFQWDEKFIYIILEYCDGGDLSTFIKKRRKLPERVVQKFMRQLALGLQFLRSKDICHFDLKPQNLLLITKPTLTLKIADFGFAQFLSKDAHRTSIRGSPLYMAPEMLLKKHYDAKADLWSVGIIAYECLFGKPPLPSATCQELVEAVQAMVPIEVPHGSVSDDCQSLVSSLLVYDPAKRIGFEKFFDHPFLDLEHCPSESSYEKAVKLVQKAVVLDADKNYKDAFTVYCQALRYLVPYVNSLTDGVLKRSCYDKVLEYTKRAEEIKVVLYKFDDSKLAKNKRTQNSSKTGDELVEDDQQSFRTFKTISLI